MTSRPSAKHSSQPHPRLRRRGRAGCSSLRPTRLAKRVGRRAGIRLRGSVDRRRRVTCRTLDAARSCLGRPAAAVSGYRHRRRRPAFRGARGAAGLRGRRGTGRGRCAGSPTLVQMRTSWQRTLPLPAAVGHSTSTTDAAAAVDAPRTVIHPRGLGPHSRRTKPDAGGARWSAVEGRPTAAAVTGQVRGLAGADVSG